MTRRSGARRALADWAPPAPASTAAPDTCPRRNCGAEVEPSLGVDLADGGFTWSCARGHHGPRFVATAPAAR